MGNNSFRTRICLAAAVAAGVAAHLSGATTVWSFAAAAVTLLALAAGPRFLRGAMIGATTASPTEKGPATAMSGTEFEVHVANIARSCGAPVIMTSATGDWGVDLIVGLRPNRLAIQCKRRSRPVGTSAVQEVVAGAAMHDCTRTMVVTNHEFTAAARKLAAMHECVLVGGDELCQLRRTIRRLTLSAEIG